MQSESQSWPTDRSVLWCRFGKIYVLVAISFNAGIGTDAVCVAVILDESGRITLKSLEFVSRFKTGVDGGK